MPKTSAPERKLKQAISEYMSDVEKKGLSNNTVVEYAATLNDFFTFYVEEDQWNYTDPSFTTIQAWRDSLLGRGLCSTTVNQYLVRLHTFFEYASEEGGPMIYERNPVSKRLYPNTRKEMRRPYEVILTNQQIAALWRNKNIYRKNTQYWPRNYAVTILLLTSMIRNSELLSLTPADLDWEYGELAVQHGKGDKYRTAPFPKIAQQAVKIYLESGLRPATATDNDPLFGTQSEKAFQSTSHNSEEWHEGSSEWLSKMVEQHVYRVVGVHGVRTHDLRHLGAYLGINNGKTLEELQSELGHSSPNTTMIYSGRLTGRRNRGNVKAVFEEMDYQIRRNSAIMQNMDLSL